MKNPFLLLVTSYLLLITPLFAHAAGTIRVAVLQDVESFSLKVHGPYEVKSLDDNETLWEGKELMTTVSTYARRILIGGHSISASRIVISPFSQEDIVLINGRRFRGDIQCLRLDAKKLTVVNILDLEDYVKGILYHEASHYWPMEVLKAQAIVCRSYAVYQKQANRSQVFDLTNDQYSQIYGGRTSERSRTNKVVEETAGLVLSFQEKVIPAYFHATCGGHTEDASRLWNTDVACLKGVVCKFCQGSPHYQWHCVLALSQIEESLKSAGYPITKMKDIRIISRNTSGRIVDLELISAKKSLTISAKDFRLALNPRILRSTNFTVRVAGNEAVFEGKGWGHGVGFCQWGGYFMAKDGRSFREILSYYYPGTEVVTVNRIK
ncbi:MAG: SpoIID/LytB domain-containing protein [Candidatus Omnitrophica bacterium]|nr:SpoIID/LytB domain-containing protein [Candidatus Omnitrophota bacterium]